MQTVQEIYQSVILSLPENEQLKLASLILEKVTAKTDDENREPQTNGETRKVFGMWQGEELTYEEYLQLDHNERIDFDLGRAYADNHEDED